MEAKGENFDAQKRKATASYGCSHHWCNCAKTKENGNWRKAWFEQVKRFAYIEEQDEDEPHIFRGTD